MNKLNLVFLCLLFRSFAGFSQTTSLPVTKHRCVVIAHRGDHTNAPENTLAAYQHAIEDGADFVEIDLRTTKDSQLVIMHNATIDHITGRQGQVSDFLFDSIRQIKVREPLHPEWGLHAIPTFKEVLQLCTSSSSTQRVISEAVMKQHHGRH